MSGERELLDDALQYGQKISLRRNYGANTRVQLNDILAVVRSPTDEELLGGVNQTSSMVIMSPTPLIEAQWPGGELPSAFVAEPMLPRKGDQVVIRSRVREVGRVKPFYVEDELVRIELEVLG